MKIVLAGNFQQYKNWIRENGFPVTEYRYVSENEHIMALELAESDIVEIGSHWESKIDRNLLKSRIRK